MDKGQVTSSAAEIYEEFFLPALFQQWAGPVVDAANIQPDRTVLDVACGTGVVARAAAGLTSSVVGLDINTGMLSVAQRINPKIDWREGAAESLPFEDASFDAVTCQFGLMFFEDRKAAVNEMARVLKPGGKLAVAVWDSLDTTPGYAAMVALLQRLFGDGAANGLRSPFILGDVKEFQSYFDHPQLADVTVNTLTGHAQFESIEAWVYTDVKGWVLSEAIKDAQFAQLLEVATSELAQFVSADGTVKFEAPAHILTATKTSL